MQLKCLQRNIIVKLYSKILKTVDTISIAVTLENSNNKNMSSIKVQPMNADIEEFTNDNTAEAVPTTAVQNNTALNDALNLNTRSSDHDGS